MSVKIKPVSPHSPANFVGRASELSELVKAVDGGPRIVFIHGLPGIGKTSLLEAFSHRARDLGTTVVHLDCRAIEPTERGVLHELGQAVGSQLADVAEAAARLRKLKTRITLIFDNFEVFRLIE